MILKPLTAFVTLDKENDCCSIVVRNEQGQLVMGPLVHRALSTKKVWYESVNDHLVQLKTNGLNIVSVDSNAPEIKLPV